ncbi:TolC family protein [Geofilum rubicundum]|nr:TolC family protein [Geofilum rubicundum]
MKRAINILLLLCFSLPGFGQSFSHLMQSIEQNNTQLITLQKWLNAEKTKAKTGTYPENPEVTYNHLWSGPDLPGNQKELEITQSFKWPGYYTSKSAIQELNYQQKEALAEKEKREILHNARSVYFHLVWLNKQEALLKTRKKDGEQLVAIMQEGFERGEISKPAFDKARIYNIGVQTEWQKTQSEIKVQRQYLRQLNGGHSIDHLIYEYPLEWKLPDLDSLLINLADSHPDLTMAQLGLKQSEKEVSHQKMNRLPTFAAGYRSESFMDQNLKGFHVGISIPLWQNTNKVKQARLQIDWAAARLTQQEGELERRASNLFHQAATLQNNFQQMKAVMEEEQVSQSHLELLKAGQISFSEYLTDVRFIQETWMQFLETEYTYYELLSQLNRY